MSKHIAEWLSPYLDGELRGGRLQQVEAHLVECESCRIELDSLKRLSSRLSTVALPEFTPTERFAAQVNLRLPQKQIAMPRMKILEIGWWMIPVGLLGAWILVNMAFAIGDVLTGATQLGFLSGIPDWTIFDSSSRVSWSSILAQIGILRGNSLDWVASIEAFSRAALPQLTLQLWIALLYLSWLAVWWVRRTPQGMGQPLES